MNLRFGPLLVTGCVLFLAACGTQQEKATRALLKKGLQPDVDSFLTACSTNDLKTVDLFLQAGLATTVTNASGESLLMRSVAFRVPEVTQWLLTNGVPINAINTNAETALSIAVKQEDVAVARQLLDAGADLNIPAPEGQSLLLCTIMRRQNEMASLLLEKGADANSMIAEPASKSFKELCPTDKVKSYVTKDRRITALMLASLLENEEMVGILLASGADKRKESGRYRMSALSFAAGQNNVPIMQMLLGKDPKKLDTEIKISLSRQRAVLYKNGAVAGSSPVSTGRAGYRTPKGTYVITNKYKHWISTLYHAPMPYFMRLSCSAFGMHVGVLPGYPASHGCIRMPRSAAVAFFSTADTGTVVHITD